MQASSDTASFTYDYFMRVGISLAVWLIGTWTIVSIIMVIGPLLDFFQVIAWTFFGSGVFCMLVLLFIDSHKNQMWAAYINGIAFACGTCFLVVSLFLPFVVSFTFTAIASGAAAVVLILVLVIRPYFQHSRFTLQINQGYSRNVGSPSMPPRY